MFALFIMLTGNSYGRYIWAKADTPAVSQLIFILSVIRSELGHDVDVALIDVLMPHINI